MTAFSTWRCSACCHVLTITQESSESQILKPLDTTHRHNTKLLPVVYSSFLYWNNFQYFFFHDPNAKTFRNGEITTVLPIMWPEGSSPPLWKQLTSHALNLSAYKLLFVRVSKIKAARWSPWQDKAGIPEDQPSHLWVLLRSSTLKHRVTAQHYFLAPWEFISLCSSVPFSLALL